MEAGKGKDQIASRPFTVKIKTRKDAQVVMDRAKVEWFKMLQEPEK